MVTNYTVDFTDQARSFLIAPYTTNGPVNPNSNALGTSASAATTLLLYGKGAPDYGERLQENMVHMLENFASATEPVYPIKGQLWYNRSGTTGSPPLVDHLQVFNGLKHQIFADSGTMGDEWFAVDPPVDQTGAVDITSLVARFTIGAKVRIFEYGTANQEEYTITTAPSGSPILDGNGRIFFQVSPTPSASRVGWYVGGWEYLVQNNAPLQEDLDANDWRITSLGTPLNPSDAASKDYVDTAIAAAIIGGGASLDDLLDVSVPVPVNGDILVFDASLSPNQWTNETPATFISTNNIVTTAGTTFTGSVTIPNFGGSPFGSGSPLGSDIVVNKTYVDAATAAAEDGVVDSATFNVGTSELTLTRTNGLPNLVASFAGISGSTGSIEHTVADPSTFTPDPVALAYQRLFYDEGTFPDVSLTTLLSSLNEKLGRLVPPKGRIVFQPDGVNTVVNLSTNPGSGSPTYQQCNPLLATGGDVVPPYTVGSNRLSVYVNGVKYISSEHGLRKITASIPGSPIPGAFRLHDGTPTGLLVGSPSAFYSFQVSVNGQASVLVTVPGVERIGNLVDAINAVADANYTTPERAVPGSGNPLYAFGAVVYDGAIFIYSSLPGIGGAGSPSTSKIDLIDGAPGSPNAPLFSQMGTPGSPTFTPYVIDLPLSGGPENGYTPGDYGYREIGRVGQESFLFEFTSVLTSSATIEVIVEPDMFGERLP